MHHYSHTTIITTLSGIIGGLGKAATYPTMLANITLHGIVNVAFYAGISAAAGYVVKCGLDYLSRRIHHKNRILP